MKPETYLTIDGVKTVNTDTPEWTRYYEAYERWKASRSSFPNEMEWWMAEPNKPGYFRAAND